jgi:hypothetical protein
MTYYSRDWPKNDQAPVFDTSFPAVQGASGAPVISIQQGFPIVGMVLGNVEHHLRPIQTCTIIEDDYLEETKYYLPVGQAIQSGAIIDFLTSIDISPSVK